MSNVLTQKVISLDTFTADVDIALNHSGSTVAPMFIDKVVYDGLTPGDHILLTDTAGHAVQAFTCDVAGKTYHQGLDDDTAHRGLKMLAANAKITSGTVYIHLR
jgi:hydrogenase maturation factor